MKTPVIVFCLTSLLLHTAITRANPLTLFEAVTRFYRQGDRYDEGHVRDTSGQTILRQKEYDFIIVGAGTAGAVLANRLSENPKHMVLLLEAGQDETILNDIPVFVGYFQLTDYNWGYVVEPQDGACLAMKDKRCRWPRGKALGGSSVLNYMIYIRGHRKDYDDWAKLGNTGWGYDDVLPYFKKSEDVHIPELMNSTYHSEGGYLNVEYAPFRSPLSKAFIDAGLELGHPTVDYNGESQMGFAHLQLTMRKGVRCSSNKAFLRPVRNRRNLHISINTRVTKILIDPVSKQTIGVEFIKRRLIHTVYTRKEVILSAGALASPQILMLSGIGPKEHLEELGIKVIQDLKVGHNLQEHVGFLGAMFTVNDTVSLLEKRIQNSLDTIGPQYFFNGTGPLTLAGGTECVGYIRTKYAEDERPDIELLYVTGGMNSDSGGPITDGIGLTKEFYNDVYRSIDNKDVWSIWPLVMHPKSRGILKLKDSNIFHWPKFYPNFFTDPHDMKTLIEGIKFSLKLAETLAFKKFDSQLHRTHIPGCANFTFGSDEYWDCASRYLTASLHHQSGTCKMGPETDQDAVVDPQLRVYGVKGLRVADASIIPFVPTAHTNAPVYMIGEKASDMIKEYWAQIQDSHLTHNTVYQKL